MQFSPRGIWPAVALAGFFVTPAKAGTFTVLYNFQGSADHATPQSGLVANGDGTLYGTTSDGGVVENPATAFGSVFAFTPQTRTLRTLYAFKGGADGQSPLSTPLLYGGRLYGTTSGLPPLFGRPTDGTAYAVTMSGTKQLLHAFAGQDGAQPQYAPFSRVGTQFYGTTFGGGLGGEGTLFSVTQQGAFDLLHDLSQTPGGGYWPNGPVVPAGPATLVGTTFKDSANQAGSIFSYSTTTRAVTTLHAFTGVQNGIPTGPDGAYPAGQIAVSKGTVYGTTQSGGANGTGTLWAYTLASRKFVILYDFPAFSGNGLFGPWGVTLGGGVLYGITNTQGVGGFDIWSYTLATKTFAVLFQTDGGAQGGQPSAPPLYLGGVLYGTASVGGTGAGHCVNNCGILWSYQP